MTTPRTPLLSSAQAHVARALGALGMVSLVALASASAGCAQVPDEGDSADRTRGSEQAVGGAKILRIQYMAQQTGYWCGPGATRIALSARIAAPDQGTLANILHTDGDGTDSVNDVTRGLNQFLGAGTYAAHEFGLWGGMSAQAKATFWDDIVLSIDNNYPVVINIWSYPNNRPGHYPNSLIKHYVTIIGYNAQTRQVIISDPGRFSGVETFTISHEQASSLIAPKGYTAWVLKGTRCAGSSGSVVGAIEQKYKALGGCTSPLGGPETGELKTPDGVGRYNVFKNGSIYWHPKLGAFAVQGLIRDAWKEAGWEKGSLGYPTSDEEATPDGNGRLGKFERGVIYYTSATGAHAVGTKIYEKWLEEGGAESDFGYPTKDEYDDNGLRRVDFERGSIAWDPKTETYSAGKP